MFDGTEGKFVLAMLVIAACFLISLPFIYMIDKADKTDMILRCESRGGVLLKNTYSVGKTSTTTWVCVKPEIIIEI